MYNLFMPIFAKFMSVFTVWSLLIFSPSMALAEQGNPHFRTDTGVATTQCYKDVNNPLTSVDPLQKVDESFLMRTAWPCAKGVFKGAWEATGGLVASAGRCVLSPFECARSAKKAVKNAYIFFSEFTANVSKAFAAFDDMPGEAKAEIICSIIGGIGTDVLLAILTAGAASGKIAITLSKLTSKLSRLAEIGRMAVNIPIGKLAKLSEKYLDKVKQLLSRGYEDDVARLIKDTCRKL
jgi:F0F1-type ATP synthase delta subunit